MKPKRNGIVKLKSPTTQVKSLISKPKTKPNKPLPKHFALINAHGLIETYKMVINHGQPYNGGNIPPGYGVTAFKSANNLVKTVPKNLHLWILAPTDCEYSAPFMYNQLLLQKILAKFIGWSWNLMDY